VRVPSPVSAIGIVVVTHAAHGAVTVQSVGDVALRERHANPPADRVVRRRARLQLAGERVAEAERYVVGRVAEIVRQARQARSSVVTEVARRAVAEREEVAPREGIVLILRERAGSGGRAVLTNVGQPVDRVVFVSEVLRVREGDSSAIASEVVLKRECAPEAGLTRQALG